MVVDEHTLHLEGFNDVGQTVDSLERVVVKTEDELRLAQHLARPRLVLGEHHQLAHAGDKIQRLGCHVGSYHNGILAQAAQHMAQSQRRAQGIAVGRLVASDGDAAHAINHGAQSLYRVLIYYRSDHNWSNHMNRQS